MSFFLVSLAAAIAVGLLRSLALFASGTRAVVEPVQHRLEPSARPVRRPVAPERAA